MAQAIAKFVRLSPKKSRLVIDAVRGKYVEEALQFLKFSPQRSAAVIYKVVHSAAANTMDQAVTKGEAIDESALMITRCTVDEGPRLKRIHPRSMGRAYPIIKPMVHITVEVSEVPRAKRVNRKTRTAQAAQPAETTE
jgi:large subunit ribosomal protein L22